MGSAGRPTAAPDAPADWRRADHSSHWRLAATLVLALVALALVARWPAEEPTPLPSGAEVGDGVGPPGPAERSASVPPAAEPTPRPVEALRPAEAPPAPAPAPPAPAPAPPAAEGRSGGARRGPGRPPASGPPETRRATARPHSADRAARPAPAGEPAAPDPPGNVAAARARYLAGDLEGARGQLASAPRHPEAAVTAARLETIARLLGRAGRWPPPGGAAALERLLELEAALGLPGESPLARRARTELAERLADKGGRLVDEGRWEEARGALEGALAQRPEHPGAREGLARIEQAAEALYLEGYALEEDDPEGAWRLYRRAMRLARPDGPLARRIAARLAGLPAPAR